MVTKEDYDNCEQENDNLRRILSWAATQLEREGKAEVAKRLDRMISEGGVTEDSREEEREEHHKVLALLAKIAAHLEAAVEHKGEPPNAWYLRADALANEANSYQPPSRGATLYEARNVKAAVEAEKRR